MCLADVGRVSTVSDDGKTATIVIGDHDRRISLALLVVDGVTVAPGDWLACHLGLATHRVSPTEAASIAAARQDDHRRST
ncbi:MAG: HypC/HybG/HupF family hydrogenase formation chaperone [Acidimicrobiales bacterium]